MYRNQFIASVKTQGKILREQESTVAIPYGTEYSLLLKNLKSVRAMAEVSIDGVSVSDGERFVLSPNSEFELDRFVRNGNLTAGNRFRFIERTEAIENHRGIGASDGLIRIEFWTEKIPEWIVKNTLTTYNTPTYPWLCRSIGSEHVDGFSMNGVNTVSTCGITVPGSESNSQFVHAEDFPLEKTSQVIVLQLIGQVEDVCIKKPITVDVKPKCVTCGKMNRATSKFCSECGTSLKIF
jgi:hypothetical protein